MIHNMVSCWPQSRTSRSWERWGTKAGQMNQGCWTPHAIWWASSNSKQCKSQPEHRSHTSFQSWLALINLMNLEKLA